MAFLQLTSENPKFSFALRKNPTVPMLARELRQGHLFGWYSNDQTFNIVFKDADRDISFGRPDDAFAYMDSSAFDSPVFILGAISEFLNHLVQESAEVEEDVVAKQTLHVGYLRVQRDHYITRFQQYFDWAEFHVERPDEHGVSLTITATSTLRDLLNLAQLFALFIALTNRDTFLYKQDSLLEKYLRVVTELNAPYYIRSLFKLFFLYSKERFEKYVPILQEGTDYVFTRGDTHEARIRWVTDQLNFEGHLLDVGCGEGRYSHLSQKLRPGMMYTGIDPDEEVREKAEKKAGYKEWENATFLSSLEDFEPFGPTEVILSEVIEHMEFHEASQLIEDILSIDEVTRIVITTPNRDFNPFYMIDENEMRHEDHEWEAGECEFTNWIEMTTEAAKQVLPVALSIRYIPVGDSVSGIHTTLGCVIERYALPLDDETIEELEVAA